jgi:hypothetical protein
MHTRSRHRDLDEATPISGRDELHSGRIVTDLDGLEPSLYTLEVG